MDLISDIEKAICYIEENIHNDLDNAKIAKQVNMSLFHFQRIFSVVCGITLAEYIRNRRMSLSKDELMSTDKSILDIALRYGYATPEGFSRAFYRFYEITPSAARKKKVRLNSFNKLSVSKIYKGENNNMERIKKRGYKVGSSEAVYHTLDMDKTVRWFEDILGWYADIADRNESGGGNYGCAHPVPDELISMKLSDFNGIHLFSGQPSGKTVAWIDVDNVANVHNYVKENGWDDLSDVTTHSWGGKTCDVTTVDGSILRFCQIL